MEILRLRSFKPIDFVSISSIVILPSNGAKRNSATISDDLPAPVRPTIPTCE